VSEIEKPQSIELDPGITRAFAETFVNRWDCYPLQVEGGTYIQVHEKLSLTHIFKHLTHARLGFTPFTIGAYSLNVDSQAKWICFDADAQPQWEELWRLSRSLRQLAVPSYLEPSRRGGHLWLFTSLLSGTDVRRFARKLLVMEHIAEYGEDRKRRIEIYPKQDVLGEGTGSFVRLPLGVHRKSGKVYPFIDLDHQPIALSVREQLTLLGHPNRVPPDFISEVLAVEVEIPAPPLKLSPKFKKREPSRDEPLSESLKHTISVFDFVSRYVDLTQEGRGLCPFHDDRMQSFSVNNKRNYWHCFAGCGGGSLIDFWMKWRELHGQDASFAETVKDLKKILL
jgi:hypothetical protein